MREPVRRLGLPSVPNLLQLVRARELRALRAVDPKSVHLTSGLLARVVELEEPNAFGSCVGEKREETNSRKTVR